MRFCLAYLQGCALLLLALAVQVGSPAQAVAKGGFAAQMPSNAVLAIGIADSKAFWAKADMLPVTSALGRLINSPVNKDNLDYQEFQLQLQKLAAELGYPATIEEFLSNVFNRMDFYITPGTVGDAMGNIVFDLGIADKEKAEKLLSVIDRKNQEAQKIAAVGADAGVAPNFSFENTELAGQPVSHYTSLTEGFDSQHKEGFYGIAGGRFLFANNADAFTAAVKGDSQSLADSGDFSRLAGHLPVANSDLVGWVDADAILSSGGMGALLGQIPGLSPSNKTAFTAQIGPNTVLAKLMSTADPALNSTQIKAQPLQGLNYVVPQPVAASVNGTLDADLLYQQLTPMLAMMGGLGGSSPVDELEQALGISIKDDVVPALGTEVLFALNGMGPNPSNPFVPLVDMLIGCTVRDGVKMAMVMKKIQDKIEMEMATVASNPTTGQASEGPKFQTTMVGDAEVHSLSMGLPGISPGYSIYNNYLIVGLTAESLTGALQRASGAQPDVRQGGQFRQLQNLAGTSDLYSFSSLDMARVAGIIQPYLPFLMQKLDPVQSQLLNQVVTDVLTHLGQITAIASQESGLYAGYVTVEMR